MNSIALMFHIVAVVIWIGGMFFAYVLLRPVLTSIDSTQRFTIWAAALKKFFPWVWLSIVVLLVSGFSMIFSIGGFSAIGIHIYVMLGLAVVMTGIFKFIYVAPYRHLCRGVEEEKWEVAAYALGTIRTLIAVNLGLGIATIIAATALADRM